MIWKKPMSILDESKIWMITGNYGSGKTELSINLTLEYAKVGPVLMVDLDIVNPYFRSAERKAMLEEAGARVMMPTFALTTVDIPALPAQISNAFYETSGKVIFDVGGDDTGSAALGRYKPHVDKSGAKMLFVMNARRPLTRDAQSAADLIRRVTARARTPVFALVNNTNLARDTTVDDILHGQEITEETAGVMGIEQAFHACPAYLVDKLPSSMREFTFPITPYMRPEWLDDT